MLTIDFKHLPLMPSSRVLDLGCGEGRHAIGCYFNADVEVVAVDLNFNDVKAAQEKFLPFRNKQRQNIELQCLVGDGLSLPFANGTFDTVICSEVLEHIPSYETMLGEIFRVLKPMGKLAVSVPRAWPEKICWWLSKEYASEPGGHVRIFNARQLRGEIESQGYRLLRTHWAHALHSPFWWLKCLWWQKRDSAWLIRLYHKMLVWDLMERPWITQVLERCLNPFLGKSVVMYFDKKAPI